MSHVVELNEKTFEAARKLITCAELQTVRLTKAKIDIDIDGVISDENPVTLSLKTKAHGKRSSESEIEIAFEFALTGTAAESTTKVISITLRLIGVYTVPNSLELEDSEIDAFGISNGMLNAWPYWREFVQSVSSRAGLPPLTVPLFRLQHTRSRKTSQP